jgi:copper binding protein CusF
MSKPKWLLVVILPVVCLIVVGGWFLLRKPQLMRHELTGTVVAVNAKPHKLTVHNEDMPGVMRAMDMDYDVKDPAVLTTLKPGETIHATLLTNDDDVWVLDNVVVTQPPHVQ